MKRISSVESKRQEYGPAPLPKGETNSGGKFAPIPGGMVMYNAIFNMQCAEYSAKIELVTELVTRMVNLLQNNERALSFSVDRSELTDLIALANIGRLYLLFQAKESSEILNDMMGT